MEVPNDIYQENGSSGLVPALADCHKSLVLRKRETGWGRADGEIDGKASSHVCYAC